MRIGLIAPPWFAVPPTAYGGIERVVSLLADGLVEAGHRVTLFASGDSVTLAELRVVYADPPSDRLGAAIPELAHALACFEDAGGFDVVNDHSGLVAAALAGSSRVPALHTVHGALTPEPERVYRSIARIAPRLGLISISDSQRLPAPDLPWVATCHNAIDLAFYPVHREERTHLAFVGRMSPDKGCHRAIDVARRVGLPLVIAAKLREPGERAYFERFVRPRLGPGVEFVGEVGHAEKLEILRRAVALLFPIDWEEPFGLVMIEALACGTPVVATRRGAVPEVVDHGRTGVIVDRVDEMAVAIERAASLDPAEMRADVRERFSPQRMVEAYLDAYAAQLDELPVLRHVARVDAAG